MWGTHMVPCHVSESFDESEPEATATESGASPMGLLSAERKVQREAAADGSAAEGRALFVKAQEARRGQLHSQQHISRKKKKRERENEKEIYAFQEIIPGSGGVRVYVFVCVKEPHHSSEQQFFCFRSAPIR